MTPTIYGIKNCDTVAKARAWLSARAIAYDFHDYKTQGIDAARLTQWVEELGWEKVLNRAGLTFRKLPEADRTDLDAAKAVALMVRQPSMIKRPCWIWATGGCLGSSRRFMRGCFRDR